MPEREHNESLRALRVQHSDEDSDESQSELESESESEEEQLTELPELRESRLGGLGGGGGAEANGNQWKTLTAGSDSAQAAQDDHTGGLLRNPIHREESKEQDVMSEREAVSGITGQAYQPQARNQLVSSVCPASSSELSPTSVAQSTSSDHRVGSSCLAEADVRNNSTQKAGLNLATVRTSRADGYNWRKYGQKQVKSPQGSRSYFRCTYSQCCAKKIEFCEQSGHVAETIYKSQHNHDPPRKVNSLRQSRIVKSPVSARENHATEPSTRVINGSNPSTTSRELARDTTMVPEGRPQDSGGVNEVAETTTKKKDALESEPKRAKKNSLSLSTPMLKPGKKPKFVVHAAGDVGISSDGYRWRKYGQKMVKGNPHPRNYYRCTSAGCPVRKHIETAVDNVNALIITYKGIHDHDMPVPKKRHGLASAPLVAATSPASLSSSQGKVSDPSHTQTSTTTQWSVCAEGDLSGKALELGGEKAMESARTLLSIGFEIKPC